MLCWFRPSDAVIQRFLAEQSPLDLSYEGVGNTSDLSTPPGYVGRRYRTPLGSGEVTFEAARKAIRSWTMFNVGWVQLVPTRPPSPEPRPCRCAALPPDRHLVVECMSGGLSHRRNHATATVRVCLRHPPCPRCAGGGTLPGRGGPRRHGLVRPVFLLSSAAPTGTAGLPGDPGDAKAVCTRVPGSHAPGSATGGRSRRTVRLKRD